MAGGSFATSPPVGGVAAGREEPAHRGTDESEEGGRERASDLSVVDERDRLIAPGGGGGMTFPVTGITFPRRHMTRSCRLRRSSVM